MPSKVHGKGSWKTDMNYDSSHWHTETKFKLLSEKQSVSSQSHIDWIQFTLKKVPTSLSRH